MFPEHVETDRLRLEQLCHENVDRFEYYRICAADDGIEEVTRYMPWEPHDHPKETADYIDRSEEQWESGEGATYVVRPTVDEEAGELAGQAGLHVDWDRRMATLGLWLRKHFWGRGYSGERAAALMHVAFERLDLEVVAVDHTVENERSRRAIEKYVERFGGRREGVLRNHLAFPDRPRDGVRYTVSREEFREHRPDDLGVTVRE